MSDELPESWELTALNRIAKLHQGFGFPKHLQGRTAGDLGFYKVSDISRVLAAGSEFLSRAAHYVSHEEAKRLRATPLPKGSVVFARIGEAIKLNRRAVLSKDALVDNNVIGAKARSGIDDRYLLFFLKTVRLGELSQATTVPAVRTSDIAEIEVPVAPTKEQRRIASKIDELFSRIDEGERALERVSTLVERYRQSVLKAAVTGELTRDWREQHKAAGQPIESGEALLARILTARREAWEQAELTKMQAKGITPKDDAWKKKYKQPAPPETTDLPELPEGWAWATFDQLCGFVTSGSRGWKKHYADHGSLFIRAQNIKHDALELDDVAHVNVSGVSEGTRTKVLMHDLLVTITGANVTKAARVDVELKDAFVSQHVALLRPVSCRLSAFLFHWIVSPANGRKQLLKAAYGAGKPGLSLEDLKDVVVGLPSFQEQSAIIDALDRKLSCTTPIASDCRSQAERTNRLQQSILRLAFSGQLVPQDATDEPAFALLERIAAERAESNTAAPKRGRKRKTK